MTREEKSSLHAIIEDLKAVQESAPTKVTYTAGRADASISYKLLNIIDSLIEVSDYEPETTGQPEPGAD